MFTLTSPDQITAADGYVVKVLGRTGLEYREGERVVLIDSEVLVTGRGMAIFKKSLERWQPPHDAEVISAEKKKEILSRLVAAVKFAWSQAPIEVL